MFLVSATRSRVPATNPSLSLSYSKKVWVASVLCLLVISGLKPNPSPPPMIPHSCHERPHVAVIDSEPRTRSVHQIFTLLEELRIPKVLAPRVTIMRLANSGACLSDPMSTRPPHGSVYRTHPRPAHAPTHDSKGLQIAHSRSTCKKAAFFRKGTT